MKGKSIALVIFCFINSSLCFTQIYTNVPHIHKKTTRIPPEKFLLKKLPPMKFNPFTYSDFNITSEESTIRLKTGKILKANDFLKQVNSIEEKLNSMGYTLRDNKTIKIQLIFPKEQLRLQKEALLKELKNLNLPPQVACENNTSSEKAQSAQPDRPKDFVPLDWQKDWYVIFGNDDFGAEISINFKIEGKENYIAIYPFMDSKTSILGNTLELLKIEKKESELINKIPLAKKEYKLPLNYLQTRELFNESIKWSTDISFSIGPVDVEGSIVLIGNTGLTAGWQIDNASGKAFANFYPSIKLKAEGNLTTDVIIAEAGINGEITVIDNNSTLKGNVEYIKSPNRSFKFSANGKSNATLLKGKLYAYAEIDYIIGSKRFEVEFYDHDGIEIDRPLFSINTIVPAEKDHRLWLKINKIGGISSFTSRNEKLEIEPQEFNVVVEIGGKTYYTTLKDYNKDGHYGNAIGEYEPFKVEIPLLSFRKIPISIEVTEKYKMGTLNCVNVLDFSPGIWNKLEICYDPITRTFSGTKSGKENEETRSVGNSNYWGERYHQIIFELTSESGFKVAPTQAK